MRQASDKMEFIFFFSFSSCWICFRRQWILSLSFSISVEKCLSKDENQNKRGINLVKIGGVAFQKNTCCILILEHLHFEGAKAALVPSPLIVNPSMLLSYCA